MISFLVIAAALVIIEAQSTITELLPQNPSEIEISVPIFGSQYFNRSNLLDLSFQRKRAAIK
jgi:hypothetical protein